MRIERNKGVRSWSERNKALATFLIVAGLSLIHVASASAMTFSNVLNGNGEPDVQINSSLSGYACIRGNGSYNSAAINISANQPLYTGQTGGFAPLPNGFLLTGYYDIYQMTTLPASANCNNAFTPDIDQGHFYFNGSSFVASTTVTRYISLSPHGLVSTTTLIGYDFYQNSSDPDFIPNSHIEATFTQDSAFACANSGAVYDAVVTCAGSNAPVPSFTVDFSPLTLINGDNASSSLYTFPGGGAWTARYVVKQPQFFGLYFTDGLASTTHFIIGTSSPMDQVIQNVAIATAAQASSTNGGIGRILASTTASLANVCNPLYGLSLGDCLTLLFWPGSQAISDDFLILTNIPPFGYAFRVYNILTASTTSTLTVIDATIPAILPGGGAHIHLDANHVLDSVLNATTSLYTSVEASSTQTFYQITSPYWNAIVKTLTAVYILGRIFGTTFGFSVESYGGTDLSHEVDLAERADNRYIGRRIFRKKVYDNRKK